MFVITDYDTCYYHTVVEAVVKLAPFAKFLKHRPHVSIHVSPITVGITRNYMQVLGLTNPIVSGNFTAERIYRPHSGGCFNPVFAHVQTMTKLAHEYIEKNLLSQIHASDVDDDAKNTRNVILIKRSATRELVNHADVLTVLETFARQTRRQIVVFDDTKLPTFNETMALFYNADLVLGPHGAGLTNILFSRAGAFVIEVHCKGIGASHTSLSFRLLSLRLGLRYYGTETTQHERTSRRCQVEGIVANVTELTDVLAELKWMLPKL